MHLPRHVGTTRLHFHFNEHSSWHRQGDGWEGSVGSMSRRRCPARRPHVCRRLPLTADGPVSIPPPIDGQPACTDPIGTLNLQADEPRVLTRSAPRMFTGGPQRRGAPEVNRPGAELQRTGSAPSESPSCSLGFVRAAALTPPPTPPLGAGESWAAGALMLTPCLCLGWLVDSDFTRMSAPLWSIWFYLGGF